MRRRMLRSLIRSPSGGGGFFAYNFAANSRISLEIVRSVISGSSEANGGVSRPDAVHDSQVSVASKSSIYRNEWANPCASPLLGWNLTGGSAMPLPVAVPATTKNKLTLRSVDDRIENFTTAILATGSRRFYDAPLNAAPRDNRIDLQLTGTTIVTPSCSPATAGSSNTGAPAFDPAATDIRLIGAWVANNAASAGDHNIVRAELRGVTGSGLRSNIYAHAAAGSRSAKPRFRGTGNKLELIGDLQAFTRTNRGIDPAPAASFFNSR